MGRFSGFGVTLKQIFKPRLTTSYPKEKRPKPERFHGRHVLNRYEDGMEKCIGCELCAGVCPARCIYVRGADNPPDAPVSPGERYGFVYEINYLRCIHCDLCVEACPTEAITETKLFEFSFADRADAIYTKNELLVDDDGRAKRQPWELWLGGEDDDTSAWMRATSPSGAAAYEGRIVWSSELGFGYREPEQGQRRKRSARLMVEYVIFFLMAAVALGAGLGVVLARNPVHSALLPRHGAGRDRGDVPAPGRPARRRGAGHRLRGRDRRPLPLRDHAARRRPVASRCASRCRFQRPAAIVLGVIASGRGAVPRRPPLGDRARSRRARVSTPGPAATSSGSPAASSPTSSGRSRSPRCCSWSRSSAASCSPAAAVCRRTSTSPRATTPTCPRRAGRPESEEVSTP